VGLLVARVPRTHTCIAAPSSAYFAVDAYDSASIAFVGVCVTATLFPPAIRAGAEVLRGTVAAPDVGP
jgi:hypothetical protein